MINDSMIQILRKIKEYENKKIFVDYETLINMWNNGGMFGLYKNYGIVCFK